ncbi:hypothetical protein AVEN_149160-1 [Araneus ventricosus]|uniref:ATP-dependent DNA helicase PIF1 n=1 Tax=Araneus ventricosus TaxID=182803 RepID=A0A4Y2WWU5_ARAVE|nr:hypothetical protein AVEN_149160-1 [Araneus ventricosus]
MTVNKSQGQTFDQVGIYLDEPVFSHGRLYVALSRSRIPNHVKIYTKTSEVQGKLLNNGKYFTGNVVQQETWKIQIPNHPIHLNFTWAIPFPEEGWLRPFQQDPLVAVSTAAEFLGQALSDSCD